MSDLTTWQAMADYQRERAQAAEQSVRELRWARHFVDEVALTLGLDANEELDKVRARLRAVVGKPADVSEAKAERQRHLGCGGRIEEHQAVGESPGGERCTRCGITGHPLTRIT